jgi:hypothetical protein
MYTGKANTGMYTGTVISDLMASVERAERRAEQRAVQQRITEELQAIFSLESISLESFFPESCAMQIPVEEHDPILMGAA